MTARPAPDPRIGSEAHFRWLHGITKAVLLLNLADALFTLVWVGFGLAREANPLFADLVRERPVLFVAAKLGLVGAASLLLWRLRDRPLAVVALFLAFLVYYALLVWHLGYLSILLGNELWPSHPIR